MRLKIHETLKSSFVLFSYILELNFFIRNYIYIYLNLLVYIYFIRYIYDKYFIFKFWYPYQLIIISKQYVK